MLDRRLFMQILAYGNCPDSAPLVKALEETKVESVLYADMNDPQGIALLTLSEDPDYFVTQLRQLLNQPPFAQLIPKPEYTMFGRTYSLAGCRRSRNFQTAEVFRGDFAGKSTA